MEKRGSKLLKRADKFVGSVVLFFLLIAVSLRKLLARRRPDNGRVMLVCFGAIGDLLLLSAVARERLAGKQVFLACSNGNFIGADVYRDWYAGVVKVDLKKPFMIYRACRDWDISAVYDSTQWANIGAVHCAVLKLMMPGVALFGFRTGSVLKSCIYDHTVPHSNEAHEVINFHNFLSGRVEFTDNQSLSLVLPDLYRPRERQPAGRKVLLHMWPSGERSHLKEWPATYWRELVDQLADDGYRVYISGAPSEKARNAAFIRSCRTGNVENLAGLLSFMTLFDFLALEVSFSISVNTGNMHMAALAGVPVIGINGPTNPVRWGPLGARSIALLPRSGNFAYLNFGFEYPKDDAAAYALDKLEVAQVVAAYRSLAVV